jgi:hypothetical protein
MADLQAVLWYAEKRLYAATKEDNVDAEETEGYGNSDHWIMPTPPPTWLAPRASPSEKFRTPSRSMDAQQQHDEAMVARSLARKRMQGSRKTLEALLQKKGVSSSSLSQSEGQGVIERAMAENPGLSRETAEQMAEDFGF